VLLRLRAAGSNKNRPPQYYGATVWLKVKAHPGKVKKPKVLSSCSATLWEAMENLPGNG